MGSTSKLSIIFVAGAWHNEVHVKPILPYLKESGYRVVPVTLRTSCKLDPLPTVLDNIDHIEAVIRSEVDAGHQVCILGHSVSGQSCAGALSKFLETASPEEKASVKHVIFIACFFDAMRACGDATWFTYDTETLWTELHEPAEIFYNDMAPEKARPFVDALTENRAQMPPPIPDLWKSVPGTYVLCKKDRAVPPERQRPEAEEMGMKLVEVDMDHCPFVSRPREFAFVLDDVLKEL